MKGSKRGPKTTHYVTANGETILGLTRRKMRGKMVFVPIGRDSPSWSCDEAEAVFKYRVWKAQQEKYLSVPPEGMDVLTYVPDDFGTDQAITKLSKDYWLNYCRNLILTNPRKAAVEMDCKPLALLAYAEDLKPPEPSVTLDECFEFYAKRRKKVSDEELKKVSNNWIAFQESVSPAKTLEEITTG